MTGDEMRELLCAYSQMGARPSGRVTSSMLGKVWLMPVSDGTQQVVGFARLCLILAEALELRVFKPWEKKVLQQMLAEITL